ncbi:phage tail tape measure protein, TP901 family, core region [Enterococcus faecium EnGen0050]|uniref:phage tail tape measure protein n=1 Tax=Enterococcus faecium TaxID=1352 RepID=UPI0002A2D13C|nr:phage tail tape measure protein [Enterococcus faecium]ELB69449.1 phage tail tape measure protein, TP901 family, core region [Enterococcus faecium EnGen0051]ELB70426.1 phage tail tape measure protein, TP901 family, core region [Enterococcus faecium EnGen0050]MCZ2019384.1 phage tail tape measure protein [Enterococcus faecium]MCZ2030126.1 phage tail tape measure protein [Enterococcus faecium]MCZ2063379.1 phage tail tape measure protein [Enterococcus faecium]
MEQFSVEALLKATDSGFVKTFKDAQDAVKTFEKKSNSMTTAVGKVMQGTGAAMTKYITTPLIGVGVAAAKVGGDFEAQMSRVKAISGATGDTFEQMKQQAIDLGAKTAFSAKESAAGMENLASAGFSAQEIMKAMPGLLDLAAVSGGDVALASENTATALRGFGLEASEAGHVADVFARAAADTNAEVGDMGEALKYVAPVANSMGISLEETAAAIGIMSDAGIKGSQAGTTLRGALSRLARPTKAMQDTMDNLGVSFYDADGKMKPLKTQVELLKKAFEGLTPEQQQNALVTLYGQESLSGMMALIDKGPDSLGKLTKSLKDSDGAADDMARTMQDNMNSSIEQMFGAFESAAIVIQKILAPSIRKVADAISGLVEKFVSAPESTQKLVVAIGLIVAAIGPLIFMIGSVIIWINRVKVALALMGTSMSGVILPVLGIVAAISALIAIGVLVYKNWDKIAAFGKQVWKNITMFVSDTANSIKKVWKSTGEWFNNLWKSIKEGADNVWTTIQEAPGKAADWIKNKWTETKEFFSNLWSSIANSASEMWNSLKEGVISVIDDLVSSAGEKWEGFKNTISTAWKTITSKIKSGFDFILKYIGPFVSSFSDVFSNIVKAITSIFAEVKNIIVNAWEIIKSLIAAPLLFIIDLITGDFEQMKEDLDLIWNTLVQSVVNIWTSVKNIFTEYIGAIVNSAVSLWTGFIQSISNIWNEIVYQATMIWIDLKLFFTNLWIDIKYSAIQMWINLKFSIIQTWIDTKYGAIELWNNLKQWFFQTVNNIVQTLIKSWNSLKQGTIDLFNNTVQGAKDIWTSFKSWIGDLITGTKDNVIQGWKNLKQGTIDTFNNLVNGAQEAWDNLVNAVSDTVDRVTGWFDNLKNIDLLAAGKAIMDSFLEGLQNAWKSVQDFVGGIGDWIREHKGPIQYDRKLLIPAGQAIMNGLNKGLTGGFNDVQNTVGSMADFIAELFNANPDVDIATNLKNANKNIGAEVEHKVNMGGSTKPAVFKFNLGRQSFRLFVDDISQAMGEGADINLEF